MYNSINRVNKEVLISAKKQFIYKFITSIIIIGLLLTIPVLYSLAVDNVSKGNYNTAISMVIISIALYIVYRIFEHFNQITYYLLYNKLFTNYNDIAIEQTHNNSIFSLSRFTLGEYANILNQDIEVIATFYSNVIIRIVQAGEFLFIFAYFFFLNIYIFLITVVLTFILLIITIKSGNTTQKLYYKRKESLDIKTSINHEIFNGINEIKGYNFFDKINNRTKKSTDEFLNDNAKYNIQFNMIKFIVLGVIEVFRLVLFIYGIYLISIGKMEIGVLLILYSYYQKIIDNFTTISAINVEFRNLKVSKERFNKILEFSKIKTDENKIPIRDIIGNIEFHNVLYGYKDDPILDNVSFKALANSINIIISKIRTNKNGISDLLLKLNRQHKGLITIDKIDINNFEDNEYYNYIASTNNQPFFFNISIKENLRSVGSKTDQMIDMCKMLRIDDDINNLKKGYDTIINKDDGLSSNTRYLLAFARIFLKDSKIMIFDEVISYLDDSSKKIILNYLKKLRKDHTIIIITKEENMIDIADNVIKLGENS